VVEEKINTQKLEGVSGWLLVFIISLFLSLVFIGSQVFGNYSTYTSSGIGFILLILFIFQTILIGISLVLIIEKKKIAMIWVTIYLGYTAILNIIVGVILYNINPETASSQALQLIWGIVLSIIWLFYFFQSERIKNTLVK